MYFSDDWGRTLLRSPSTPRATWSTCSTVLMRWSIQSDLILAYYYTVCSIRNERFEDLDAKRPLTLNHKPHMTAFQYNHSFGFQKPMKLKVVKWGWKNWNEHDLMHIFHKQCEIIQKIEWNSSNGQIHCFHYVR